MNNKNGRLNWIVWTNKKNMCKISSVDAVLQTLLFWNNPIVSASGFGALAKALLFTLHDPKLIVTSNVFSSSKGMLFRLTVKITCK
jgi:hypothetical protein